MITDAEKRYLEKVAHVTESGAYGGSQEAADALQIALRAIGEGVDSALAELFEQRGVDHDAREAIEAIALSECRDAVLDLVRRPEFLSLADEIVALRVREQEIRKQLSDQMPIRCTGGCGQFFPTVALRSGNFTGNSGPFCESCYQQEESRNRHKRARRGVQSALTRARSQGLDATLTSREWEKTVQFFGGACAYCGGEWYVVEHILPIGRGGGTTEDNCVPSCYHCNSSKSTLTVDEMLKAPSFASRERLEKIAVWQNVVMDKSRLTGPAAEAIEASRKRRQASTQRGRRGVGVAAAVEAARNRNRQG